MFYNSRLGLLSEEEVFKLNYKIAKFLKKKFKNTVFIGASKLEGSADEIIKRTKKLSKSGVDVFSIIFGDKYYNDNQVYSHFKYINDNTSLPLLLHLQMMMNGYGIKPPIRYPGLSCIPSMIPSLIGPPDLNIGLFNGFILTSV